LVSNLVIVDTQDALLVADKNKLSNIKKIVEKLKNDKRMSQSIIEKFIDPGVTMT
jgi:hypothetical protein